MKLYLIIKQGVYIQDIVGVYDTEEAALIAMAEAEDKEIDDYHHFTIEETSLNHPEEFLT